MAQRLFAEQGYASVGIRQIAQEAGANVAAIHYHFGSKENLYKEALRAAVGRPEIAATWDLLAAVPEDRDAAARALVAFVRSWLTTLLLGAEASRCTRLVLREALQPGVGLVLLAEDFAAPREERLERVLGVLAPELDADERTVAVRAVLGQLVHYLVFRELLENVSGPLLRERLARIADTLAAFTLRALGGSDEFVARALSADSPPADSATTPRTVDSKVSP